MAPAVAYEPDPSDAVCTITLAGQPAAAAASALPAQGALATESILTASSYVKAVSIACTGGAATPVIVGGPNVTAFSNSFTGELAG